MICHFIKQLDLDVSLFFKNWDTIFWLWGTTLIRCLLSNSNSIQSRCLPPYKDHPGAGWVNPSRSALNTLNEKKSHSHGPSIFILTAEQNIIFVHSTAQDILHCIGDIPRYALILPPFIFSPVLASFIRTSAVAIQMKKIFICNYGHQSIIQSYCKLLKIYFYDVVIMRKYYVIS